MWFLRRSLLGKHAPLITGENWFNKNFLPKNCDLSGLIVLINFWDYSCIHCINTLPYLEKWWKRYRDYNFLIIGIHTPEFNYARDTERVEDAVIRFRLTYPVVNDPDFENWNRYKTTAWPRVLLTDARRIIRYDRTGHGDLEEIESHIQELLRELHPDVTFTEPLL